MVKKRRVKKAKKMKRSFWGGLINSLAGRGSHAGEFGLRSDSSRVKIDESSLTSINKAGKMKWKL